MMPKGVNFSCDSFGSHAMCCYVKAAALQAWGSMQEMYCQVKLHRCEWLLREKHWPESVPNCDS